MREMRDSGIEWVGQMPKGWELRRAKTLFTQRNSKGNEIEVLLSPTQKYGVVPQSQLEGVVQVKEDTDLQMFKTVHKGDFVISLRSFQGGFEYSLYEGVCSPAYQVFYPTSPICDTYYRYLFKSQSFISKMNNLTVGIREGKNIQYVDFANSQIPVPPLAEQERIAAFLDAECAEIDAVLEKTRASIEEYKKLKQAVITQAVTKGVRGDRPMKDSGIEWIGDIPAEWKVASIGRFCFVTKLAGFEFTNDMMSNIQDSGDIPIVRAQNIKMGKFINNISEFIPYRISQKLERCALNRKCLIITFIGAGIGEVAIFNEPKRYHLAPNVAKIVINVGMEHFVTEEYLLYFLMSFAGQEEINKIKKATAQPSLSMGTIRSIKMVLPDSIEEQSEIVSYLDMRCASIDALIAKKQQYLIEIENYKKSLIYEYVTGKKEVKTNVLAD